jgi:hypothetical protein
MSQCVNGHENPDGQQVCGECGAPLERAAAPGDTAPEATASGQSFWARQEVRSAATTDTPPPSAPPAKRKRMRRSTPQPLPTTKPLPTPAPVAAAAAVSNTAATSTPETDEGDAPPEVAAVSRTPGGGTSTIDSHGGVIALVGAAVLVFGSFLPWAKLSANLVYGTKDGIDGNGVITLLIAVVVGLVAGVALIRPAPSRVAAVVVLVGGLVAAAVSVYEMVDVSDEFGDNVRDLRLSGDFGVRIGVGLYLCLLASAIVVVGAVLALRQSRPAR